MNLVIKCRKCKVNWQSTCRHYFCNSCSQWLCEDHAKDHQPSTHCYKCASKKVLANLYNTVKTLTERINKLELKDHDHLKFLYIDRYK